ncbi:putative holin-like toxin [Streptococcus equi subsp. zooepidemicus]|uniref:putative holin-like toxin n=1 Tax=Streptococcus equi TaxID=1336 RepID=UPI00374F0AA8
MALISERWWCLWAIHQNLTERSGLLSTYETLQLMLAFGSFLLTLISLVVAIVILNNKK